MVDKAVEFHTMSLLFVGEVWLLALKKEMPGTLM
jgi:hypothetical protein